MWGRGRCEAPVATSGDTRARPARSWFAGVPAIGLSSAADAQYKGLDNTPSRAEP
jgi:hypothetical protein